MEIRLIEFKDDKAKPVYVNPALVRHLYGAPGHTGPLTHISFDKNDYVLVSGDVEHTARQLQGEG